MPVQYQVEDGGVEHCCYSIFGKLDIMADFKHSGIKNWDMPNLALFLQSLWLVEFYCYRVKMNIVDIVIDLSYSLSWCYYRIHPMCLHPFNTFNVLILFFEFFL